MNKQQLKAKDYLMRANRVDVRIQSKIEQIQSLRDLAERISPFYSNMPKATGDTSKIENAVVEMINLEEEIKEDVKELVELKRQIKRTICQLSDPEQQCLLEKRYLLQETWERIADDLDISTRTVFRIHDEALKNIVISESWQ